MKRKDCVSGEMSVRLAGLVQGIIHNDLKAEEAEQLEEKVSKHENCEAREVSKINPKVWGNNGAEHKTEDLLAQKVHNIFTKATHQTARRNARSS